MLDDETRIWVAASGASLPDRFEGESVYGLLLVQGCLIVGRQV